MPAEKFQVFVGVQFEVALAWSQASSEGAAGAQSPVSDSHGVSEGGADSHYVDVAAADLGMPAGTGEGHQAVGANIHVGRLVGSVEGEDQELPLVQVGSPEALVAQWTGGTAAVVGVHEFGLGLEWASLVGA